MPLQSNVGDTRELTGNLDTLLKIKITENCASLLLMLRIPFRKPQRCLLV